MTSDSFFFFVAAFFKACNGYWCFSLDLEFIGHSGPTKDYAPFRCILFRKLMHLFFFFLLLLPLIAYIYCSEYYDY